MRGRVGGDNGEGHAHVGQKLAAAFRRRQFGRNGDIPQREVAGRLRIRNRAGEVHTLADAKCVSPGPVALHVRETHNQELSGMVKQRRGGDCVQKQIDALVRSEQAEIDDGGARSIQAEFHREARDQPPGV